jgi:hypothetical protein
LDAVSKSHSEPLEGGSAQLTFDQQRQAMGWGEDIKARFPDWGTDHVLTIWPSIRQHVMIGQTVFGEVVARAPFGVWIDIGIGHPALLLVPEMLGARERSISFD